METLTIDPKEIIDWLRQRRKLSDKWAQKHKALRPKIHEIAEHIRALSLPETRDFLAAKAADPDPELNFLDLLSLNELLLKSKEAEGRTLFGGYSSRAVRELQALIKVLEKEGIGLASLATELSQLLSFEVPGARKVIKSCEGQIADLQFKLASFSSSIANARAAVVKLAQKYHKGFAIAEEEVEGLDVDGFLNQFVMLLPLKLKVFLSDLSKVEVPRLVDYYVRFAKANNFEEISPRDFGVLAWLFTYGDSLAGDFAAGLPPDPNAKDQLYHPLLAAGGYFPKPEAREGGAPAEQRSLTSSRARRGPVAHRGRDRGPGKRAGAEQAGAADFAQAGRAKQHAADFAAELQFGCRATERGGLKS